MNQWVIKVFDIRKMSLSMIVIAFALGSAIAHSDELSERKQASAAVTQQLLKQLGGHLKKEMQSNGPVAAIKICQEVAPKIASKLSLENGWRVTRVSTKTRNPLLGNADKWEAKTLKKFEERAAKGEKYSTMVQAEVVEEAGVPYYRFMKPLAIKPVCLACHGSDEQIPDVVKVELDKRYPFDQAKGYKLGELRGAVSIKQPMDVPLRGKI